MILPAAPEKEHPSGDEHPELRMIWVIGRLAVIDELRDRRWEKTFKREQELEAAARLKLRQENNAASDRAGGQDSYDR